MTENELRAKVHAVNAACIAHNALQARLLPLFAEHVGCKVKKKDGNLFAGIAKRVQDICKTEQTRYESDGLVATIDFCPDMGYRSIFWKVKACVSIPDNYTHYHKQNVYIGETDEYGVLISISTNPPLQGDYTAESVKKAQEHARQSWETYIRAQSACGPFAQFNR